MTPQQIEALKLALEALIAATPVKAKDPHMQAVAITALEKALAEHAMREVQRLGQEIDQEPAHPERHELQAKGEHPAPCARHCEANAFKIVIKNLKAQLAQPEQEPVAHCKVRPLRGDESFPKVEIDWVNQPIPGPLYTSPPQRTWVGLTGLDQKELMAMSARDAVFATEAKLKEKNT